VKSCATCGQRFSEGAFCPFDGTKLLGGGTETKIASPAEGFSLGSVVGNTYRIDKLLGEGGMGIVFAVTHLKLNKRFALKLLKPGLAQDADTRARFLVEAQAAGQIKHPNVVEITDYTSLPDGGAYMVMEYLEGQPLSKMIRLGGALPALRAVNIVKDVASALQAAHDAGVVHRDLKPDNVFVTQHKDGRDGAKILDFGVAKVAGSAKLTRTGMVFGTPHYMSPEQASGGVIDHRTDVYALGVIMYEMFTGRVPFEADTYMGVLTKHMFEAPVPPSKVIEGAAKELGALEDVTLKALAKRPEERYASMSELVQDIDRIVRIGNDGHASIASSIEGLRAPGFAPPDEERRRQFETRMNLADELEPPARAELAAAQTNQRERRVRAIGVYAVIGVLALGVAIGGAALVMRKSKSTDPGTTQIDATTTAATTSTAKSTKSIETAAATNIPPPLATTATAPPAATTATTTETVDTASTVTNATATVQTSTHPTTGAPSKTQPPKKTTGPTDLEDPWAPKK
jgi:serine/threonine-protein kinase